MASGFNSLTSVAASVISSGISKGSSGMSPLKMINVVFNSATGAIGSALSTSSSAAVSTSPNASNSWMGISLGLVVGTIGGVAVIIG